MANEMTNTVKPVVLLLIIVMALAILLRQSRKEPVASHTWLPIHGVLLLEEGHIFKATPYIKLQICTTHEGEVRALMIPVEDVPWPHGIDYEQFKLFMGGTDEQGRRQEEISRSEDESNIPSDKDE